MDSFALFCLLIFSPLYLFPDAYLPFSEFYELILIGHLVYSSIFPRLCSFMHIVFHPHDYPEEVPEFRKGNDLLKVIKLVNESIHSLIPPIFMAHLLCATDLGPEMQQ